MLTTYAGVVDFFTPDAKRYLPLLFGKRSLPAEPALTLLSSLERLLHIVDEIVYKSLSDDARLRIKSRDIRDWPIVATALMLNCPIWTEDRNFFGTGIPTWTTDRIHIYFETAAVR